MAQDIQPTIFQKESHISQRLSTIKNGMISLRIIWLKM